MFFFLTRERRIQARKNTELRILRYLEVSQKRKVPWLHTFLYRHEKSLHIYLSARRQSAEMKNKMARSNAFYLFFHNDASYLCILSTTTRSRNIMYLLRGDFFFSWFVCVFTFHQKIASNQHNNRSLESRSCFSLLTYILIASSFFMRSNNVKLFNQLA